MSTNNSNSHEAGNDLNVPAQQEGLGHTGLKGTMPSNTVPSKCINNPNTHILRTAIDSLYLSFPGDISLENSRILDNKKKLAQSSDPQIACCAQMEVGGHIFEVSSKGRSVYNYVLRDNWYELQVSSYTATRLPMVFVKISSELLTRKSLPVIVDELLAIVSCLGKHQGLINISRLDLCADFVTDFPLDSLGVKDWISRAKGFSNHFVSKQFSGVSIGAGGGLSARLYDKTLEMVDKKDRPYLRAIWEALSWNKEQKVWRLEFQFQRRVLKELNVPSYDVLFDNLAGLWNYATYKWLRLAIPNTEDSTQSRWPVHPLWETLRDAPWSGNPNFSRVEIEKGRLPSDKTLFVNGFSGITSFMAREGLVNIEEALTSYYIACKNYHDAREQYSGEDFYGYALGKVKMKQKLYNTQFNVRSKFSVAEEHFTSAEAYRRKKDGE